MALSATSTADCKKIVITVGEYNPPNSNSTLTVRVTNSLNQDYEYDLPFTGGTRIVTPTEVGSSPNGIFIIEVIIDGNSASKAAVLLACDVLCCLASKMEELLDCDCDCNKCSAHFVEAQKIFLLLKAAEHQLAGVGGFYENRLGTMLTLDQIHAIILSADEKYKTAQDMCAGHCGCNC